MRSSIDTHKIHAAGRKRAVLRQCRLGMTGLAVWTVASTLQPASNSATAAPPARVHHRAQGNQPFVRPAHGNLPSIVAPSPSKPKHSSGCSACGKKRRNFVGKLLDGVTAGTDWLIFGSSYQESCDCDTACDAGCDTACDAVGLIPYDGVPMSGPEPTTPGIHLLPAPVHSPPIPPRSLPADPAGRPAATLEELSPKHPTTRIQRDEHLDPFSDDPMYHGMNPAISRSAYYE